MLAKLIPFGAIVDNLKQAIDDRFTRVAVTGSPLLDCPLAASETSSKLVNTATAPNQTHPDIMSV
jgi:hypothetical protein